MLKGHTNISVQCNIIFIQPTLFTSFFSQGLEQPIHPKNSTAYGLYLQFENFLFLQYQNKIQLGNRGQNRNLTYKSYFRF